MWLSGQAIILILKMIIIFSFIIRNPDSTLAAPVSIKYPDPYPGLDVLHISDVNNDKLNDVIIGYSDSIGIFFQDQLGGLEPVKTWYSGRDVDGLKTGDLNNDGLNDIAVCHWNDDFIKGFLPDTGLAPSMR